MVVFLPESSDFLQNQRLGSKKIICSKTIVYNFETQLQQVLRNVITYSRKSLVFDGSLINQSIN